MNWPHGHKDGAPNLQLLAAYADGELEGEQCRALKELVESWLRTHPKVVAELASLRRLERTWQATTPADPGKDAWDTLRVRLRERLATAAATGGRSRLWRWLAWGAGGLTAAAAVWLVVSWLSALAPPPITPTPPAGEVTEVAPLPVATEDEIEILHVEGADTETLVVGALPVQGPLELAGPGDITLKSVQPARQDNMVPGVFLEGPAPMIWAPMDEAHQE
jgi:anti-sigma factor RsiW